MENLLELIAIEALISGVYNYSSWKHTYTLPDKNFFIEKQNRTIFKYESMCH